MSQRFTQFYNPAFSGLIIGRNISHCLPSTLPPRVVPMVFDWNKYIPGSQSASIIGVSVNHNQQQIVNPIDMVQSLVIDNLACNYPVTVLFPDTGFELVCPANDQIASPVLTNVLQSTVLISGLPGTLLNPAQTTTVYYSNVSQMPVNGVQVPVPVANLSSTPFDVRPRSMRTSNQVGVPAAYPGNWTYGVAGEQSFIVDLNLWNNQMTVWDQSGGHVNASDIFATYRSQWVNPTTSIAFTTIRLNQIFLLNPQNSVVMNTVSASFSGSGDSVLLYRFWAPPGWSGPMLLKDDVSNFNNVAGSNNNFVFAAASASQIYGHMQLEMQVSFYN